jgi:hypothetical protein
MNVLKPCVTMYLLTDLLLIVIVVPGQEEADGASADHEHDTRSGVAMRNDLTTSRSQTSFK